MEKGTKISFHCKTWVKLWQIPQNLLNDHFTNVVIKKVIKSKFFNNCRAHVRTKNKMIKMQHSILYRLTKKWFSGNIWKIKQGSLKRQN